MYIILESKNPQRLQNKMFSAFHDFTLIKWEGTANYIRMISLEQSKIALIKQLF